VQILVQQALHRHKFSELQMLIGLSIIVGKVSEVHHLRRISEVCGVCIRQRRESGDEPLTIIQQTALLHVRQDLFQKLPGEQIIWTGFSDGVIRIHHLPVKTNVIIYQTFKIPSLLVPQKMQPVHVLVIIVEPILLPVLLLLLNALMALITMAMER